MQPKLSCALVALLACARAFSHPASSYQQGAFELDPVADGVLLGFGVVFSASAYIVQQTANLPDYDERSYNLHDVNWLDRKLSQSYSEPLDHWGTATCAVNLALPFVVYAAGWACDAFTAEEYITMSAMFAECYLLDYGAKNFLKVAALRKRPYMYYDGYPTDALDDGDFEFSLPSGHTTDSFLGAGFLTYTFCRWYPASRWKIPLIATSYTVAVGTAVLRVASGNHFLSDVVLGSLLGSAIGYGVPILHELVGSGRQPSHPKAKRAGDVELQLEPTGVTWQVAL